MTTENSKDYKRLIIYALLIIVFVLLITKERQGRYELSAVGQGAAYILDTKTSQLWFRLPDGRTTYLGTNKNPKNEDIEMTPPKTLSYQEVMGK